VMGEYGLEPQIVLTTPILVSWDGDKMSSSLGNNIPLAAPPDEMFGRTMRIPDEQLPQWWQLVAEQTPPDGEPMGQKLALARWIVARSHGEAAAEASEEHFARVVRRHEAPEEIPEVALPEGDPVHLPALLVASFDVGSTSEARRLIQQGGVKLDGIPGADVDVARSALVGALLQVGKRRFGRLTDS
jgi:tyrosyl-tRNA synthetase